MPKHVEGQSPRGGKRSLEKVSEGLFEKVRGSAVWWVRCKDRRGRMRIRKIGGKAVARVFLKAWRLRERALMLQAAGRVATPLKCPVPARRENQNWILTAHAVS